MIRHQSHAPYFHLFYLFLCQRRHSWTQHFGAAAFTHYRLAILPIVRDQIGSICGFFGLVIILHLKF